MLYPRQNMGGIAGSPLKKRLLTLGFFLPLAMLALAGCEPAQLTKGKSPLMPAVMSPDSVALDMFFIRFPFGDPTVNEKLWEQIDEQQLPPDLRERLTRNGFRVGIISGQIPSELSKLMTLTDKPAPQEGESQGSHVTNLEAEPRVTQRHLQVRAGKRAEILASSIYPELPVLTCKQGQISGQTYYQAQGIFAARSLPQPDGRIRLELLPELHHGPPRQRWVGNQGMLRLDTGRPKEVYDDLAMSADMAPGAMLVLSSLPNRPGSLGHHFFTQGEGQIEQKLLVIRFSQTQHDGLFNPPEPLKLDDEQGQ